MKVKKYTPYYVQVDFEALSASLIYGVSRFHRVTRDEKKQDINWIKDAYDSNDVFFVREIAAHCEVDESSIKEI